MDAMHFFANNTFSKVADKLRNKSEEELKLLYFKLFSNELNEKWKEITKEANFKNASDEEISKYR